MLPIDFFHRSAARHPGRIALSGPDSTVSYAQLHARVQALASALQALDAEPQSRVAICATNSIAHVVALLAVMAAGKTWVPLNYRSTVLEIGRIIEATEPGIVMTDATGAGLVRVPVPHRIDLDAAASPGAEGRLGLGMLLEQYAGRTPVRHESSRDATQAIKFTGGTTGLPKGVMQPYRAWNTVIDNQIAGWGLTAEDRFVAAAPLTHGTSTYLLPVLAQGGSIVLLDTVNPAAIAEAFRHRGGTISFMPPTLIYMLMAHPGLSRADFPALRHLVYGGGPMPPEKIAQVRAFFGPVLGTTYGQTEAPQIVTMMPPDEFENPVNHGSVGRATRLSQVAIVAPDGSLARPGQAGEILVAGDLVMTGYWRLPELTGEVLADGWLHTGDIGMLDERGYLYIKDRLRDVIITGGFNVYPVDVENALSEHAAVHECSVYGVPDDKWGEAVQAAVQLRPGAEATPEALMAFVRQRLGPVQTPKCIHIYDNLPRSAVGKVLKNAVRAAALEQIS